MVTKQQLAKLKVLSFDGDMTLWDFYNVMRRALRFTLYELRNQHPGPATTELTIDTMIDIRNKTAMELRGKVTNLEEIRYQAFRRTLQHIGIHDDDFAGTLNALYLKHRFEDIDLYPDVLDVLRALGQHYQLGLLSNGNSYPDLCGLSDTFIFTVFAQDMGVEKPGKRIFNEALRQAGCTAVKMMHIGDSLKSDVLGAQQVGVVAVWLNRSHKVNETAILPDIEIHSLYELIDILKVPTEHNSQCI